MVFAGKGGNRIKLCCSVTRYVIRLAFVYPWNKNYGFEKNHSFSIIPQIFNFIPLISRAHCPKVSENKGFNESYNGSARVINLCTFPGQLMQNKQVHKTHLCTSLKVVMKGSQKLKPSPTSLPTKLCPTPNGPQNLTPPPIVNYGSLKHKHW